MKVELLTPEREKEYSAYILRNESSTFNASILFRDFIRVLCPDSLPYYFIAIEENEIVGVLPSFLKKGPVGPVLNSMPWFGNNPGVIADTDGAAIMLLQAFENTAKWTECFSSSFISPLNQDQDLYDSFFWNKEVLSDKRVGLITGLPILVSNEQFSIDLLKKIHQKTKERIIKASKSCMIYESYTQDDWDFLKRMHKSNMTAVDLPFKNKEFDIIKKNFKKGVDYKMYAAIADDSEAHKIAVLLVWYFNKTVDCIVLEVDSNYKHLCPTYLLVFSAMGDAAQRGCKWWNWGRVKPQEQESNYHFRKRFGSEEREYKCYTQMHGSLSFNVMPKWLADNYPYFYVMPYGLLEK
jgi:hypothetical protein